MPLLSPDATARGDRVLVAGTSGSGKTTLAAAVARATGLPHTEIDGLHHGPGWTVRPTFVADAVALAESGRWVTEWQYSAVRPLFVERCDLLVWLDLPTWLTMWQVTRRTVVRRVRRVELWNGNVEPPLHRFLTDRDHIVRWAWRTRHRTRERVEAARDHRPELPVVRLRSRAEVSRFCERLSPGGTPGRAR